MITIKFFNNFAQNLPMHTFKSDLSGKRFPESQKVRAGSIRKGVLELMQADHQQANIEQVALSELYHYRQRYIERSIRAETEYVTNLEREVLDKLKNHELVSDQAACTVDRYTLGERIADKVADFGGSWKFIILFTTFIAVWIVINLVALFSENFDPYPFILLNLMLSCLAALQAPVIMMSQNRAEAKDRQRAIDDYKVNLKSEIEIQTLHEKIDHLIIDQHTALLEVQDIQIEMLKEIMEQLAEQNRKQR